MGCTDGRGLFAGLAEHLKASAWASRGASMSEPAKRAAVWKRVIASILDFFTAFFVFGMAIGYATGETTSTGFRLTGTGRLGSVWAAGRLFRRPPLSGRDAVGPDFRHCAAAAAGLTG